MVFWLAHVFAMAVSAWARSPDAKSPFRESLRYALVHSVGLLIAAVVPLVIVLLGVANLISDETALWTALWVDAALAGAPGVFFVRRLDPQHIATPQGGPRDRSVGRRRRLAQGIHALGMPASAGTGVASN